MLKRKKEHRDTTLHTQNSTKITAQDNRLDNLQGVKCRLLQESTVYRQITMDKEMNDMRENLGREMVAAREANSKLTTSTTELTDLRTKYTVTVESLKLAKTDTERLETEKSAKTNELQAAQTEKVSASSFSFSENTRPSKCAAGKYPDKSACILRDCSTIQ